MPENRNRPALNRWHVVILVYICFIYGNSLTPASISSQESGFLLGRSGEPWNPWAGSICG